MALDAVLLDVLKRHCSALGDTFTAQGSSKVLCSPSMRVVFAKVGQADQVLGEAESLSAMYRASQAAGHQETLIPTVHAFGTTQERGRKGFLVTDYKNLQSSLGKQAQRTLGRKLAEMHQSGTSDNGMYGFSRPTHCGATEQDNTWTASWPEFWADRRIGDLVRRSGDAELVKLETQLRKKVYPLLFNEEAMRNVRPSIIHGDLWSGNSGTDQETGEPFIFDPSSSYSHNEAELGIMRMFGGYTSDFFESYHDVIPKAQPYYSERIDMYEAYHHLNHFVIFGGSYKSGAVRIFKKLIAWAEKEGKNTGGGEGGGGGGGSGGGSDGGGGGADHSGMAGGGDRSSDTTMSGQASGRGGLRGGGASSTANSYQNTESLLNGAHHLGHPPPPPGSGAAELAMPNASVSVPMTDPITGFKGRLPPSPSQIADFFSQMACYIWFSNGHPLGSMPVTPSKSPSSTFTPLQSSPLAPRHGHHPLVTRPLRSHAKHTSYGGPSHHNFQLTSNELSHAVEEHLRSLGKPRDPTLRRLQPRSRFLRFTRDLLATTQVSNSVILLALIYIIRLKTSHPGLLGRDGSEFRLAVSSLMLANKILDDNTYLNKTWAEISGLPLVELGKAELEFWLGLKMKLHVTTDEYQSGLQQLELLAEQRSQAVKDRDASMRKAAQQQQQQLQQQHHHHHHHHHQQQQPQHTSAVHGSFAAHLPSFPLSDVLAQHQISRRSLGNIHTHHFSPSVHALSAAASSPEGMMSTLPFQEPSAYPFSTSPMDPHPSFQPHPPSPLSQVAPSNDSVANFAGGSDFAYSTPATSEHSNHQFDSSSALESHWPSNGTASAQPQPLTTNNEPWGGITPPRSSHSAHVYFNGSRSSQTAGSFGGLKRDYERSTLGGASPAETSRAGKRFATELSAADDLQHYRISSSHSRLSHSPTDNRGTHRRFRQGSRDRFQSIQQQQQQQPQHHHHLSVSPTSSRLSSVGYQGSPLVATATPSTGPFSTNDDSLARANSYQSAFQTALTPDFLAQPLEAVQHQRCGPLQYYSLAAGQPFGVIGSYMPPEQPSNPQPVGHGFPQPLQSIGEPRRGSQTNINAIAATAPASVHEVGQSSIQANTHYLDERSRSFVQSQSNAAAQLPFHPLNVVSHTSKHSVENRHVYPSNYTAPFVSDAHAWPLTQTSSHFLYPHHFAH